MKTLIDFSDEEKVELIRDLVRSHGTTTYKEFAKKHDIKEHVASALITKIRKAGIPLPKRLSAATISPEFAAELKILYDSR